MAQVPIFDENSKIEKSYHYDDGHYAVQHGNVFKMVDDEGYVFTDEISISQLEIYGEELIEKPVILELKVLAINERADGTALITGEDGCGLELVFEDEDYQNRKAKYEIGKIGRYYIMADVLTCELPEDYAKGIRLEGEDAANWYKWTEQEELIDLIDETYTDLDSVAVYSKSDNFEKTGIYNFTSIVKEPGFVSFDENPAYDDEGELIYDGFKLCLPNQFNKENPIFVLASIMTGKFPARIFQNLPEDDGIDFGYGGWPIKGTVKFNTYYGNDWWSEKFEEEEIFRFYGQNPVISYEERMARDFEDEDDDWNDDDDDYACG